MTKFPPMGRPGAAAGGAVDRVKEGLLAKSDVPEGPLAPSSEAVALLLPAGSVGSTVANSPAADDNVAAKAPANCRMTAGSVKTSITAAFIDMASSLAQPGCGSGLLPVACFCNHY